MGNTWITDIRHFLDDDGSLVAGMPKQALKLANYFGRIIKAVTGRNGDTLSTGVNCRRRPGRKPCPGEVVAVVDEHGAIFWSCPVCEDNGTISGWKGTMWDWSVSA